MGKILLTGVDGNVGQIAADILLQLEPKENLIFCGYSEGASSAMPLAAFTTMQYSFVLLALAAGAFPGVFEETGRLIAYKAVLKNRKNRETSISHGIGHGGFEAMYILGATYITYIAYAVMINTGAFGALVEQAAAAAPAQAGALSELAGQLAELTLADVGMGLGERVFAVLFHIGASILVFYACRDKKRFWLYPLAVVLHTAMDFIAAMYTLGVSEMSTWALEGIFAVFGVLTFCGAYFLLYRKDRE